MQLTILRNFGSAALILLLASSFSASSVRAEDLPPPPESTEMPSIDAAEVGAELPPPPEPGVTEPSVSAEAPLGGAPDLMEPATEEELPPIAEESEDTLVPEGLGLSDVPPVAETQKKYDAPSSFSSSREITDLSMEERMNSKELVLWLYLGPSYASLSTKGTYTPGATFLAGSASSTGQSPGKSGGLGYSGGIGFMLGSALQAQMDFLGTPRTRTSTVDQVMFGLGPRLGFISVMGMVGVQRGADLTPTRDTGGAILSVSSSTAAILAYGVKGGIDIVLGHSKDSRVSYGLSPEVFYVTSQASDGYTNAGAAVSFRIYGYDKAF